MSKALPAEEDRNEHLILTRHYNNTESLINTSWNKSYNEAWFKNVSTSFIISDQWSVTWSASIMNLVSLQFINIINIRSYETVKSAAHRVNALHENKEKVNGYSFQILTLVLFVYIWRIFNSCWKFEWTIKFKTTLFRFPNPTEGLEFEHFPGLADAPVQLRMWWEQ